MATVSSDPDWANRSPIATFPADAGVVVLRSIVVKSPVFPGDSPTTASPRLIALPYFISTLPSGSSVVCTVVVSPESKPRTAHQVTVYWSAAALTTPRPPDDGSRSERKAHTRGGPVSSRETLRSVLDLSSSPKVTLPSELTNALVASAPYSEKGNGTVTGTLSSSASVSWCPSVLRNAASIFDTV